MAAYSGCGERDGGIGHGKRRSRTGLARVCGDVGLAGGSVADGRRQAGSGMARSRARARLNCDLDSTICETYGLAKEGARHHGYTGARGYHLLLAIAAGTGEVLMSRRAAEVKVMVDEFPQAQVPGEGGWQEQAGIGHQAMVVKEDADTVGIVLWQHLLGAPCFRAGFCSKIIIPG